MPKPCEEQRHNTQYDFDVHFCQFRPSDKWHNYCSLCWFWELQRSLPGPTSVSPAIPLENGPTVKPALILPLNLPLPLVILSLRQQKSGDGSLWNLLQLKEKHSSSLFPQDVVKVGAVDADKHQSLGGQYGVQGFPTIKIFGSNKNKPEDYQGKDSVLPSPGWGFHLHREGRKRRERGPVPELPACCPQVPPPLCLDSLSPARAQTGVCLAWVVLKSKHVSQRQKFLLVFVLA